MTTKEFCIAGLAFVEALQKMVNSCIKSFVIAADNPYLHINIGSECQEVTSHDKDLPNMIRFGIRGYFVLNKDVLKLLMGFFSHFEYKFFELVPSSVHSGQMDDMVWFHLSKTAGKKSAKYLLEYYASCMELRNDHGIGVEVPISDKVTSLTYSDDESVGSALRRTIHLHVNGNDYFKHWIRLSDKEELDKNLVGYRLIDAVSHVLAKVYDS